MNKQRKVVITTTYNEMGIIIDTKAEEVAQPNLQPTCNQLATDCINRQAVIDEITEYGSGDATFMSVGELKRRIEHLPSVQQWTPVSEKAHPTKAGRYLVTDDAGGMATVEADYFIYCDDGSGMWLCSQNVTAWMPAPKPYREEGDPCDA